MLSQIESDLVAAMRAGNVVVRETLRMLKSAIKNVEIEKGSKLTDEEIVTVAQKEVKRRNEAIESYKAVNKPELAEMEAQEAAVLARYVPAQMSEEQIASIVTDYLAANPSTPSDTGKVMGALNGTLKGKADMSIVARLVKEHLTDAN